MAQSTRQRALNNSDHGSSTEAEPQSKRNVLAGSADPWRRATQVSIIGLFIIALLWVAHVSQAVLVPVLLAWVIATMLLPIVRFLQEWKVPRVLSAIVLTALLVAVAASVLVVLATPAAYWLGRATELGALLREKFQMLNQPLALHERRGSARPVGASAHPTVATAEFAFRRGWAAAPAEPRPWPIRSAPRLGSLGCR
jgi:hypothetical protein